MHIYNKLNNFWDGEYMIRVYIDIAPNMKFK